MFFFYSHISHWRKMCSQEIWICLFEMSKFLNSRRYLMKCEKLITSNCLSYLPNALNNETISPRLSLKFWWVLPLIGLIGLLFVAKSRSNFSEKRIFRAVPKPCTCNFPHNRHLSHPTQSMIFDMLRNFSRNSVFNWAAPVLLNIRLSLKCEGNDLQMR